MLFLLAAVVMVLTQSGADAPAPSLVARPAQAMRNPASHFEAADYPAQALAQRAQGSTGFRLRIGEAGRAETCDIERSSGSDALDRATCQVLTSRARFRPALDAAGRPVASDFSGTIRWILPE
jgi:protein TonB